jgi:glycosyltransferase involved in cell wall biosynthesis
MLQDTEEPYEVVLNLFNDRASTFQALAAGHNPKCRCRIRSFRAPQFFNIAAANNIGLAEANGQYVLFANSDIIYPSNYLRLLVGELARRDLCYVLGARVNLTQDETAVLRPPLDLTSFDFLNGSKGQMAGGFGSPWTIRRDVALLIGGFDSKVLCHEDSEFNDRVIHFLRRKGLQAFIYAASDMVGYHLHHAASELYSISELSRAILEPRRERLQCQANSSEDVVGTRLDDPEQLLRDLYQTAVPTAGLRTQRLGGMIGRRLRGALRYLLRGSAT